MHWSRRLLSLALAIQVCSCSDSPSLEESSSSPPPKVTRAAALIEPSEGNRVKGFLTMEETEEGMLVEADLFYLTPGEHRIQIASGKMKGTQICEVIADPTGYAHVHFVSGKLNLNGPEGVVGEQLVLQDLQEELFLGQGLLAPDEEVVL